MAEIKDPENTLVMETTKGKVVIEMMPNVAPGHVERIKELAREGAYDGVVFHRVIADFMAQTGDVRFGKTGGKRIRRYGPVGWDGFIRSCKPHWKPDRNKIGSLSLAYGRKRIDRSEPWLHILQQQTHLVHGQQCHLVGGAV